MNRPDYKATVFLPATEFPMKAGLAKREPEILKRWQDIGLYRQLRAQSKGREKFVLHDGPPYANGHLHIGHALNKILKDVISRTQQMLGRDSNYVPGWDCHGLPIEWKIEEKYRAAGKNKDEVPIAAFRKECRDFAEHWIGIQREEFKRMGLIGDWDNPYSTMSFAAEAQIAREIGKFLMDGSLYKGAKPVLWSVVEKTALAEAEVEYHDRTAPAIWVAFPVEKAAHPALAGASVVIWTTTPWTIPGNRAIAYGEDFDYVVAEIPDDRKIVVAESLLADTLKAAAISDHKIVAALKGTELSGTVCRHPFHGKGYDFQVPLLAGGFVETGTGTGFVHVAPGHGQDDWELGKKHGIEIPETVGPDGVFYSHVPLFAGKRVLTPEGKDGDITGPIITTLKEANALLAKASIKHSYPHSWRSKAPLIFRTTAQWFISMEKTGLRARALAAIDATRFVPESGKTRLRGMIAERPDWCVSRQRAWGVPIAVFLSKKDGQPLRDQKVLDRIAAAFAAEGADAWFADGAEKRFLAPDHDPADYEKVTDILDVWFDSGSTHSFVLENGPWDLKWPASLYLEGTDQHRGWFHSSLLESCGTRGRAPYEAVLTHGFVLAEDGQKMSKSLGNIVSPQDVVNREGADILRLWVVGSDYEDDLRIGPEILKQHADVYRRLRNTLRYLLGSLKDFSPGERVEPAAMPELERWILHRLAELDRSLRAACDDFLFHRFFAELHTFCAVDLSAFYFDVRKDALYCDPGNSPTRRAARTVMDTLFETLTAWLAPFACFTAEEAWLMRHPDRASVHLRAFPEIPATWRDDPLAAKWEKIRALRRVVTGALELERAEKRIGSGLQAAPAVHAGREYLDAFKGVDLAEIAITSGARLIEGAPPAGAFALPDVPGVGVVCGPAAGEKCERCWKVLPDVGRNAHLPGVCSRCADAVAARSPSES